MNNLSGDRALTLPQDDDAATRDLRARELAAQREAYSPWTPIPSHDGSPRPMHLAVKWSLRKPVVPAAEGFWRTAMAGTAVGMTMGAEVTAARLRALVRKTEPTPGGADAVSRIVARYLPMFTDDERSKIPLGGRTLDDEGFALQRLYGTSPYRIEAVRAMPAHVKVRDDDVAKVLPAGCTLDGLRREGSLFMVDLRDAYEGQLGHLALVGHGIRTAPTTLFFVDPSRRALRPLAIQLFPEPIGGHPNPVFTPAVAPGAWLAAKLFANQAEAIAHVAGLHSGGAYAFTQAVVAMRRTMSVRHPIQSFSQPWMNQCVAVRAMIELSNYPTPPWKAIGGPLGGQYWRTFRLDDHHLRRRVEARGVDAIPVFPWRDNMLDLWDAFADFASNVVALVYRDDGALAADVELQSWAASLCAVDQCDLRSASLEATGGRFTTRAQLVDALTTIHFFLSAWHGYDTFHWPWFAWIPSTPLRLTMEPPVSLDDVPAQRLVDALEDPDSADARAHRAGILAVNAHWHRARLTTGGADAHFVPDVEGYLRALPGADAKVRAWFGALDALDRRFAERDASLAAAGHMAAPRATYPQHCCGNLWY